MRFFFLFILAACGRATTDVPVNPFKGSWTGVAYPSSLTALYEAQVTFEEERVTWRINKQPGTSDFLVAEGQYTHNETGFLILTLDRARYERNGTQESLRKDGACFATEDATCVIDVAQSSQYLVSGQNVQFSVKLDAVTVVTNVNRNL